MSEKIQGTAGTLVVSLHNETRDTVIHISAGGHFSEAEHLAKVAAIAVNVVLRELER